MSEMVERIARALFERDQRSPTGLDFDPAFAEYYSWDGPNYKGQEQYRAAARAAIEAMREPTRSVVEACSAFAYEGWGDGIAIATECWKAGIQAALTDKVDA